MSNELGQICVLFFNEDLSVVKGERAKSPDFLWMDRELVQSSDSPYIYKLYVYVPYALQLNSYIYTYTYRYVHTEDVSR